MRGALMFEFTGAGAILGGFGCNGKAPPNLTLHFADENLERSASGDLNALAEQVAGAMKRSTSPNIGSKSGPQLIETAPRDGGFLILEEGASGKE